MLIYKSILIVVFILASAFFSGSEVALFSLDKTKLNKIFKVGSLAHRYISTLIDNPRKLLITILLGNNLSHVGISIVAVSLTLDLVKIYNFSAHAAVLVDIVLITGLVIIFGEITPKIFASKKSVFYAKLISFPLYWIYIIVFPLSEFMTEVIRIITSGIHLDKKKVVLTHEELPHLAELGAELGTLQEDEHDLIKGVVDVKDLTVQEVMRHRVDIIAVSTKATFEEIAELILEKGHSRLPIYKKNIDDIIGVIYAKDLLPFWRDKSNLAKISIVKLARKVLYVPETKRVNDLMNEFREKKMHLAIVVDEHGGTSGLITLEDILEEMIGDIRDEYDKEEDDYRKIDDKSFLIDGSTTIVDVNELLSIELDTEQDDYETIAGFIMLTAGEIPKTGYSFIHSGCTFTVEKLENNRIESVLVKRI